MDLTGIKARVCHLIQSCIDRVYFKQSLVSFLCNGRFELIYGKPITDLIFTIEKVKQRNILCKTNEHDLAGSLSFQVQKVDWDSISGLKAILSNLILAV